MMLTGPLLHGTVTGRPEAGSPWRGVTPVNVQEVAVLTVAERVSTPPVAGSDEGLAERSDTCVLGGFGTLIWEAAPAEPGSTATVPSMSETISTAQSSDTCLRRSPSSRPGRTIPIPLCPTVPRHPCMSPYGSQSLTCAVTDNQVRRMGYFGP